MLHYEMPGKALSADGEAQNIRGEEHKLRYKMAAKH